MSNAVQYLVDNRVSSGKYWHLNRVSATMLASIASVTVLTALSGTAAAQFNEYPIRNWVTTSSASTEGSPATRSTRTTRTTSAASPTTQRSAARAAVAGAAAEEQAARPAAQRRTRVASLGRDSVPTPAPQRSLTGGSIAWRANSGCLAGNLRNVIAAVAANYGPVTVNSTCRSRAHNRRVGGASKSWHLTGEAADLRVHGNVSAAASYMRSAVGGFKHYGGGLFHIDNGAKRSF